MDDVTFTQANSGTFVAADRGVLNPITPAAPTTAQFIRFTMLGNQTPDFANNCPNGAFSGCQFTDLTELAVIGSPAAP